MESEAEEENDSILTEKDLGNEIARRTNTKVKSVIGYDRKDNV